MRWPCHRPGRLTSTSHHSACHCFWPQAHRTDAEVIFQLVTQKTTGLGPAGAGTEPLEERGEHAVVCVLHIVSDAYRIPHIAQMTQVVCGGSVPGSDRPGLSPGTTASTCLLIQPNRLRRVPGVRLEQQPVQGCQLVWRQRAERVPHDAFDDLGPFES